MSRRDYLRLTEWSTEKLMDYAQKKNIELHSKMIREIIQADIASALSLDPNTSKFQTDVGAIVKYRWYKGGLPVSTFDYKAYLENEGVKTDYLFSNVYAYIFYAYLYEFDLKVPEGLWYPDTALSIPSEIYCFPPENWEALTPYPIKRGEYMQVITKDVSGANYDRAQDVLVYQTKQNLLDFIASVPEIKRSFESHLIEPVTLCFIVNFFRSFRVDEKIAIKFFSKIHDYPGRRDAVEKYLQNQKNSTNIFRSPAKSLNQILAYAPYWFEKDALMGRYTINDEIYTESSWNLIDGTFANEESENMPLNHFALGKMIQDRDPILKHLKREKILEGAGLFGNTKYDDRTGNNFLLIKKIKETFDVVQFDFNNQPSACKNKNTYYLLEDFGPFFVTYGNYWDFVCYDPEDLLASFREKEDGEIEFGRPDQPSRLFRNDAVLQLNKLIAEQNPLSYPQFKEKMEPISTQINRGLLVGSDLKAVSSFLKKSYGEDRKYLKDFMMALFYAGMYQRSWQGPGHPYPMKTSETSGSCQEDIDFKMSDPLSDMVFARDKMSWEARTYLDSFPAIAVAGINERFSEKLWNFIEITRKGEWCVGHGSALMIESAYYYLKLMGIDIPGFDYSKFERDSTHRANAR